MNNNIKDASSSSTIFSEGEKSFDDYNSDELLVRNFLNAATDFLDNKIVDSRSLHLMANKLLKNGVSIPESNQHKLESIRLCENLLKIQSERFMTGDKAYSLAFIPVTFHFRPAVENKKIAHNKIDNKAFERLISDAWNVEVFVHSSLVSYEYLLKSTPYSIQELLQDIILHKKNKFLVENNFSEDCFQQYFLPLALPLPAHLMFDSVKLRQLNFKNSISFQHLFEKQTNIHDLTSLHVGNIGEKDLVIEDAALLLDILRLQVVLRQFQDEIVIAKNEENLLFKIVFHIKIAWPLSNILLHPTISIILHLKDENEDEIASWVRHIHSGSKSEWSNTLGMIVKIANDMKITFLIIEMIDPFAAYDNIMTNVISPSCQILAH